MANSMKSQEFKNLLKLANIPIPAKPNRDDLWRLCLQENLVEPVFVQKKDITIIKSALQPAMTLNSAEFKLFSNRIETYVSIISRLRRRASLIFYFHILRLQEQNIPIPNFYKEKDTYFKHWLLIGLQSNFPDQESKHSYQAVSTLFEDVSLSEEIEAVKYFDQILAYAAITFKTCIENNAWYPLFDKLTRLAKLKCSEWNEGKSKDDKIGKYTVLKQIRGPAKDLDESLPDPVKAFIKEVRVGLFVKDNDEYIGDAHAKEEMTFQQAFQFNMWMQTHFQTLEVRMTRLSPVFSVSRSHIRLDFKTLTFLFMDLFPEKEAVRKYKKYKSSMTCSGLLPGIPTKLKKSDFSNNEKWIAYKVIYEKEMLQYKELKKEIEASKEYLERKNNKSKAAHKLMLPKPPEKLKKKDCTSEQWLLYNEQLKKYKEDIKILEKNPEYIKHEMDHRKQEEAQTRMVSSFFKKSRKACWSFDCSIQTDGVSISRQFSRERNYEYKPPVKNKEITIVDDYDKNLSCFIEAKNTLVMGLDPGRVNLACLSYIWIKENGKIEKKSWSLSRAQYYNDSGITQRSKKKMKRFKKVSSSWSQLGTLHATQSSEILNYVEKYNLIKDAWWKLALKQKESRDLLSAYSGKKRALNNFFIKVKNKIQIEHPGIDIHVAYGSAAKGMCSTGRGEVSAPIGETYKTCCQHFTTSIQDESYSTKVSFETGKEMEKVYKTFYQHEEKTFERFGHCKKNECICMLAVNQADKDLVDAYKKRKKKPGKPGEEVKEDKRRFHYPILRGLQFCPETCMYLDRDMKASLTIARLAVMRIVGNERPRAFISSKNTESKAGEDLSEA